MKKRIVIASILGLVMAMAMSVPAMAAHPDGGHHAHHIHHPNGNCIEIASLHSAINRVIEVNQSPLNFDHYWESGCPD